MADRALVTCPNRRFDCLTGPQAGWNRTPHGSTSIDKRRAILEDSRPAGAGRIEFAADGTLPLDGRVSMYEDFLHRMSEDCLHRHEVLVDYPFDSRH
jgi:hypothetical protein